MINVKNASKQDLSQLRQRISQASNSGTLENYKSSVIFYTRILPKVMGVERCTIFILDSDSNKICSVFGTGLEEMHIMPPLEDSIVGQAISTGQSIIENNLSSHSGYHLHTAKQTGFVCRNLLCAPIKNKKDVRVYGAIQLLNKSGDTTFTDNDSVVLEEVAQLLSSSMETILLNKEILQLADVLGQEVERLSRTSATEKLVIAESPAMLEVLDMVEVVSNTPVNVILLGENGTGKELLAQMIHEKGARKTKPFVPVNCACIPESLIESEFFGHERGAFTGADNSRKGRFEESHGGTLFLDEIGEMPLTVQSKFLRAIEEQEGRRLGGNKTQKYDLRLVSATNKNLMAEVRKGSFREDLYFRLFSVEIVVPPLRERREDIFPLSLHFLEATNKRFSKNVAGFSNEVLNFFEQYAWPGNVRQLLREVERLVALTPDNEIIQVKNCSPGLLNFRPGSVETNDLRNYDSLSIPDHVTRLEKDLIRQAMQRVSGNKTQAARLLSLTRQGLAQKLKRYKLAV